MRNLSFFKYLAFVFLLLSPIISFSQKVPPELQAKLAGKIKLSEIMAEVDQFYDYGKSPLLRNQDGEETFENAYIHWKRFEQFHANRLQPDGSIYPNVTEKIWKGFDDFKKKFPNALNNIAQNNSYGSWGSLGPTTVTRYGAGYNSGYGRVNCIAFHPTDANTLYIGLPQGGIWRSIDGGTNWSVLTDNLPSCGISGLVVSWANANTIYALTGDGDVSHGNLITSYGFDQKSVGVLKSIDAGVTWTKTGELPNAGTVYYGYKLIQHPTSSNTLFAATTSGIYRTTNGGSTWTQVETATRFTDIEFKPGTPNTMYAVRRMQSAGGTNLNPLYRSTDGGVTWSNAGITGITSTAERLAIGVSAANPNYVYLLTGPSTGSGSYKGIYRSTNSGVDFTLRSSTPNILGYPVDGSDNSDQTFYDLCIEVDPNNAEEVITGGINIWRSTNGGTTMVNETYWEDNVAAATEYVHADVHNLTYHPNNSNRIFACTDGGIGLSNNDGVDWSFPSADLHIMATYHADWYEANLSILAVGTQDNGTNVRYTSSNTYRHIYGADGFDCIIDQNNSNDIVYVSNANIRRTTDGGLTQNRITPTGTGMFPQLARSYSDDNDILAGDGSNVYRSTNRGTSWTTETTPAGSRVLTTCPSNSNRVYASNGTTLWRSDDKGDNWSVISGNSGYPVGVSITDLEPRPSSSIIIWACFGGYSDGVKVYSSNDSGRTWTNRSGSLPNVACHSIAVDENNTVYVGTDIGVFARPATETDWQPFLNGLPRAPVAELMVNNTADRIIACTYGRGNWSAEYYIPCPATGTLSVAGTLSGIRFYEYPAIVSSASVIGGEGTNILMKGIDNVTLTDGFEAKNGNVFKAYTGPCGNGGVQLNLSALTDETPTEQMAIPAKDGKRFPYGRINSVNNAERKAKITVAETGQYTLRIIDAAGKSIHFPISNQTLQTGVHEINLGATGQVSSGFYYLQLLKDLQVVHFHEYELR